MLKKIYTHDMLIFLDQIKFVTLLSFFMAHKRASFVESLIIWIKLGHFLVNIQDFCLKSFEDLFVFYVKFKDQRVVN